MHANQCLEAVEKAHRLEVLRLRKIYECSDGEMYYVHHPSLRSLEYADPIYLPGLLFNDIVDYIELPALEELTCIVEPACIPLVSEALVVSPQIIWHGLKFR